MNPLKMRACQICGSLTVILSLAWLLAGGIDTPRLVAQGGKKSDSVVKTEASAAKPAADGTQVVTVTLTMEKGWHTYANPVGLEDLAEAQTKIGISSGGKALDARIEYPAGRTIKDPVVGSYKVYEDTVTIKATVVRAKDDKNPLDVSVSFQACTESKCLLPAKIKVSVP